MVRLLCFYLLRITTKSSLPNGQTHKDDPPQRFPLAGLGWPTPPVELPATHPYGMPDSAAEALVPWHEGGTAPSYPMASLPSSPSCHSLVARGPRNGNTDISPDPMLPYRQDSADLPYADYQAFAPTTGDANKSLPCHILDPNSTHTVLEYFSNQHLLSSYTIYVYLIDYLLLTPV